MTDRRPPVEPPDYPEREEEERVVVVPVRRKKTRELSLEDIQREVKRTAKGRLWNAGGLIGVLLFGGGAGGLGWHHGDKAHDRLEQLEARVEKLSGELVEARIAAAKCCP